MPQVFARSRPSSVSCFGVWDAGARTPTTLSLPSARTRRAPTTALSIPPLSPMTAPLLPESSTILRMNFRISFSTLGQSSARLSPLLCIKLGNVSEA